MTIERRLAMVIWMAAANLVLTAIVLLRVLTDPSLAGSGL